ncbi:MAG TPA: hypothetical protein VF476_15570, partial [Chitinophagaceae bacterium]
QNIEFKAQYFDTTLQGNTKAFILHIENKGTSSIIIPGSSFLERFGTHSINQIGYSVFRKNKAVDCDYFYNGDPIPRQRKLAPGDSLTLRVILPGLCYKTGKRYKAVFYLKYNLDDSVSGKNGEAEKVSNAVYFF